MTDTLSKSDITEMEIACLEVQHATHTELIRFARTCTPARVLALIEREHDARDEEAKGMTSVDLITEELNACKRSLSAADVRIQELSAEALTLRCNMGELERECGMVAVELRVQTEAHV